MKIAVLHYLLWSVIFISISVEAGAYTGPVNTGVDVLREKDRTGNYTDTLVPIRDNHHNTASLKKLADLVVSEKEGLRQGVSVPYTGLIENRLIVAGGCNFPAGATADSAKKVYYKDIYILENPFQEKARWKKAGKLPREAAYGVSISIPEGVLCIGGRNESGAFRECWLLKWDATQSQVVPEKWPDLPFCIDNMAGASGGGRVYIAGGNIEGEPANRCFSLKLEDPQEWEELPSFPGKGRVQPTAVVQNTAEESRFFILGGYFPGEAGKAGHVYTDGISYSPRDKKWYPVAEILPYGETQVMALTGSAAVCSGSHHILCIGGVNRERFENAINRPFYMEQAWQTGNDSLWKNLSEEQKNYLKHPREWYHFNSRLLLYHTLTDSWITEGHFPQLALAGAAVIPYQKTWIIVNGESKPGFRSTGVYAIELGTRTHFGWINWSVLFIYLLGMLLLGYYFMRRAASSDDFFKGGGRIPWWAAGISIYATMLSAITYMAIPAKSFATNWTYYPMLITILLVSFPVIKYYLPFFRRLNVTSAYEYLQLRFNYTTRFMASILFISFMVARTALVLYLPSLALTTVTGIDIYICIILMGIVTVIYCTMGGVEAVVWGDVIQGFILVGGALFAAIYLILHTEGGVSGFIDIALDHDKFRLFNWSFDCTKAVFWVVILGGIANNLISYTSDQTVIQRYLTTKDEKSAGKGILMNGFMSVFISVIFYLIGTGLYTFFKSRPGELDYTLSNGDAIFPFFMMSQMPVGMAGLLIAAIFAATMSTIASNINSTATAFSMDIFKHWAPRSSDKKILSIARWASFIAGGLGTILAVMMATWNILSLLDYFNSILGLLSSGLGGLFIMGIFFDRIDARGALLGFVSGTLAVLVLSIYTPVSFLLYGAIGIVISVGIAFLFSLFFPLKKRQQGLTWKQLKH